MLLISLMAQRLLMWVLFMKQSMTVNKPELLARPAEVYPVTHPFDYSLKHQGKSHLAVQPLIEMESVLNLGHNLNAPSPKCRPSRAGGK